MLDLVGAWPGAVWLQGSGTAYLVVNAAHILGLALLIGAIFPLDVLLIRSGGRRGDGDLPALARALPRMAAYGLALALGTGLWLFSVRPHDYVENPAFLFKMGLLLLAFANVAWQHNSIGWKRFASGGPVARSVKIRAAASMVLWASVLLAGRWIGFI